MPKFVFMQPIYYYYEVEAETAAEAYAKTAELCPGDEFDEDVGSWELMDEMSDTTQGERDGNV